MSHSQNYSTTGYTPDNVLPQIRNSGMGGNSCAYNSNQVGGGKHYKRMRKSVRKMRRSNRGRRYHRCGTVKRR